MALLDSLKDENGKLKKPILISLIGAGGLVGYLILSKGSGSTTTSAGQSSPLTPDLTGLQTALQSLGQSSNTGGGQSNSNPSIDPPANFTSTSTSTPLTYDPSTGVSTGNVIPSQGTLPVTPTPNVSVSTPVVTSPNMTQPSVPQAPGSSGSGGGGGGGTGQVIQPIAKSPDVYGGYTANQIAIAQAAADAARAARNMTVGVAATPILSSPSLTGQPVGTSQILSSPSLTGQPIGTSQILSSPSLTKTPTTVVTSKSSTSSILNSTSLSGQTTGTSSILNSASLTKTPVTLPTPSKTLVAKNTKAL